MATITLKNIPDRLHQILKKRAQTHRRSLNSEILADLEACVGFTAVNMEHFLQDIRVLRQKIKGTITDKMINIYKKEGRA